MAAWELRERFGTMNLLRKLLLLARTLVRALMGFCVTALIVEPLLAGTGTIVRLCLTRVWEHLHPQNSGLPHAGGLRGH